MLDIFWQLPYFENMYMSVYLKKGKGVTVFRPFFNIYLILLLYLTKYSELFGPIIWLLQYQFSIQTNYLKKLQTFTYLHQ